MATKNGRPGEKYDTLSPAWDNGRFVARKREFDAVIATALGDQGRRAEQGIEGEFQPVPAGDQQPEPEARATFACNRGQSRRADSRHDHGRHRAGTERKHRCCTADRCRAADCGNIAAGRGNGD